MKTGIKTKVYNGSDKVFGIATINERYQISLSYYLINGDFVRPVTTNDVVFSDKVKKSIDGIISKCKKDYGIDQENWITDYELISF